MKTFMKWTALAVVVAAVLVIAQDPMRWLRKILYTTNSYIEQPGSGYRPRAAVQGSDQPPAPRETPAAEQLDPEALQAAADYAEKQHSLALVVTRHGYLVFEKYWHGSDLDTPVESPGLGRVVAALATGVAISERKIGWTDEPIGYLIPQWNKDKRGEITVRNLLQMSSGLGSSASLHTTGTISQYLSLPAEAPPGKRWLDQSADPDLLAYVIEKATGQPYAQYLSQAIWLPIGAHGASIWIDDGPAGNAHVDAGFFARQGDWLRVAEVLLQNGNYQGSEVIGPRWMTELLKPVPANPNYASYLRLGAHPEPGMSPYVTDEVLLIGGGANRLWLVPSLQLAILRTGLGIDSDWDDGRIPNLIIRAARDFVPPAARPGADIRQLVPNH